jgi:CubicO group peptidase (beta-lactamase class C family)
MKERARTIAFVAASLLTFDHAVMAQSASPSTDSAAYPHAAEPIGTVRQMYDGALTPEMAVHTFRNIDRLFPTRAVAHGAHPRPLPASPSPLRDVHFRDGDASYDLEQYLDLNRVAGILVLKNGQIALERYRYGNSERTRWMSMSVAKSITSTLVGAAIAQHRITSLSDPVTKYVTSLSGSAYDGVSVRDILMMSSGVRWNETYTDSSSDRRHLLEAQIAQQPGAAMKLMAALPRAAPPGTVNNYSTGETQVAGEIVRSAVGRPLADYLADRIWSRYAMEADARWWLDSPNGHEIGGSGFSATLRDYGRFGQFILDGGVANGERILPTGWIEDASTPKTLRDGDALPYGYFWWPGTSPARRRDGAFDAEGIFGQHVYINPAVHLVIVVWSAQTKPTGGAIIDDWKFFDAVAEQMR